MLNKKTFTRTTVSRRWLAAGLIASAVALHPASSVYAQDKSTTKTKPATETKSTTDKLPSGESILDSYAEAIGGEAAMSKLKSRKTIGSMEMKALGINASIELLQASPNLMKMKMDIPGIGEIAQGSDGENAWESSVISGDRKLEGEEKSDMLRRAFFAADSKWRDIYETATTIGVEKFNDRDVWVVELKPKNSSRVQTNFYDKESKLLVRSKAKVQTPQGEIAVDSTFEDYRKVDGILMPFTSKQSMLGQTQVMKMSEIKHNVDVQASDFQPTKGSSAAEQSSGLK